MRPAPSFSLQCELLAVDDRWRRQFIVTQTTLDIIEGNLDLTALLGIIDNFRSMGDEQTVRQLKALAKEFDDLPARGIKGVVRKGLRQSRRNITFVTK